MTQILERSIIHGAWVYLIAINLEAIINQLLLKIIGG